MDIQQPVSQPSEQPINPQPVQPVPVITKPPQNSWLIIILVIVGILVLSGASSGKMKNIPEFSLNSARFI